jgi:hypothetical protein
MRTRELSNGVLRLARAASGAPAAAWRRADVTRSRSLSYRSVWSVLSASSVLSVASAASLLSIGSFASILSIGSSNSILSIGSDGGFLSIGASRRSRQPAEKETTAASPA